MAKHKCKNSYHDEGAKGGCYVRLEGTNKEGVALLDVGWSCVVVHNKPIHVTWLAELVAIATGHKGGIEGFLKQYGQGGDDSSHMSYALMCDAVSPTGDIYTE